MLNIFNAYKINYDVESEAGIIQIILLHGRLTGRLHLQPCVQVTRLYGQINLRVISILILGQSMARDDITPW